MIAPTQDERDRAARLGRLAGKAGRGLGGACPYDANGTMRQRQLAVVFVRAYFEAGGKLDALDFGDKAPAAPRTTRTRTSGQAEAHQRAAHGRPYGHLGYLR